MTFGKKSPPRPAHALPPPVEAKLAAEPPQGASPAVGLRRVGNQWVVVTFRLQGGVVVEESVSERLSFGFAALKLRDTVERVAQNVRKEFGV